MRTSTRKAVAGMLAFIIGISILIVAIVPLLLYLNSSNAETLRAMGVVRDFQNQRSLESIDVVYQNSDYWIKNTGSIPITVILAVIDSGTGCGQGATLLKTNINLNPGDTIKNISSYGLSSICYIVTSRGNVFPVKEKYLTMLSQISQGVSFTPDNVWFASDMNKINVIARYNTDGLPCLNNNDPRAIIVNFSKYGYDYTSNLLTINSSNNAGNPAVLFKKGSGGGSTSDGCFSLTFSNAVNLSTSSYAVVVFYKIVFIMKSKDNFGASIMVCLQGSVTSCSSSSSLTWSPSSITQNFIVFESQSLIPMGNAPPGIYNLNISLIFSIQSNTAFYTGVEYIAVQGARLVAG